MKAILHDFHTNKITVKHFGNHQHKGSNMHVDMWGKDQWCMHKYTTPRKQGSVQSSNCISLHYHFACRYCLTIAATTCRWRLPLSQLNIKKYTQFHITVLSAKETSANLWAILGVYDHLCSCTTHKQVENDADCCSPTMWWHYSLTLTPQIMTKHLTSCHSAYKW